MSRIKNINELSDEEIKKINTDLLVKIEPSKYGPQSPTYLSLFEYDEDTGNIFLPFSYDNKYERPKRKELDEIKVVFTGQLRDPQIEVRKEAIDRMNKYGSVIIAAACGFGKTSTAINIACKIGLKTLILCHRVVLLNQWKESVHKFCPDATVQILEKTKDEIDENADFIIMNALNVSKRKRGDFKKIGFLIVDEAHLIMAAKLSECMRYIVPRYLLGLSATPYRTDGLDILLDQYFGKYKITRKLFRKHLVYKVDTEFKPDVKLNRNGRVDWGSVLESQCSNKGRNEMIISIVKFFKERTFLVLCKRVDQAKYIEERLKEENEDVTSLIGSNQKFEQKSRILVGTVQKTGVGFDHPLLNTLILASDVEQYFVQYLGRVFRREDTEPIIFDLVDNYSLLKKHFKTRQGVYIEHGGIIKDFKKEILACI